jgi:hypothetical protein
MANSLRLYFCAVLGVALLQPVTGVAEVYKCVDEATGFTLFTDTPCPKRMTEKPTNLPSDPTPQAGDPPMPPPQRLSPFPKRNTYSGTGAGYRSSFKDSNATRSRRQAPSSDLDLGLGLGLSDPEMDPMYQRSSPPSSPQPLLDVTSGTVMPRSGEGYVDPRDGTFHHDVGSGVVNTRTGEFTPFLEGQ